mmetsp:Transcript_3947/g.10879  ORF Transcript_3947/g.10879 Transcript_3947/m.10879 type:complete len:493 (-) Transcript_3947:171-1649(-)
MSLAPRDISRILAKHHYTEIKKIGEGSFGKAILVQAEDGTKLVCKMVNVSQASAKETQDAVKEGRLLAAFRHPFIVQYRENFIDNGWLCILMAYCEGGDLTSQIENARKERRHISEDQVLRWMTQALLALKYIHEKHVLHRDLKSGNFFLSKSGNLKMGDFGIARVLSSTAACAQTQIGTPYYLSPEVCQEKPYAWPSDIWAMGCILYELCALQVPFNAPNMIALVQKICRGPTPPIPDGYSDFTRQLCNEMLSKGPACRPSAETILQRPRIQTIVKQMFQQAQQAQEQPPGASPAAAADAAAGGALAGRYAESAGSYQQGDAVEYHSNTHKDWVQATVTSVDGEGRVIIDVKPNTWISKEQQAQQLRPRRGEVQQNPGKPEARATPSPPPVGVGDASSIGVVKEAPVHNADELDDEYLKLCEELGIAETVPPAKKADTPSAPEADAPPAAEAAAKLDVKLDDPLDSSCSLTAAELELLVDGETTALEGGGN